MNNIKLILLFFITASLTLPVPLYAQEADSAAEILIEQSDNENLIELDAEMIADPIQDEQTADNVDDQSQISTEEESTGALEETETEEVLYEEEEDTGVKPEEIPSLFFTFWQSRAIEDAKNAVGTVRPPTEAELNAVPDDDIPKDPGIRNIQLGGIVYEGEKDWTIWLNGQRVTPNSVPKEVLDLRVFNNYIELKWLDEYTNQVFPIRIRAHQRFNLDARIFLPG